MGSASVTYVSCVKKFSDREYEIQSFLETESVLTLEVYSCDSGEEWQAQFTHIEELTRKTGSFRRFGTFCAMLQTCLREFVPGLQLDFLSFDELDSIRKNQSNVASGRPLSNRQDKRYLILSYVTEFDKVRYPLPLTHIGVLTPEVLRGLIQNLRIEIDRMKFHHDFRQHDKSVPESTSIPHPEIARLTEENRKLLQQMSELQRQLFASNNIATFNGNVIQPNLRAFVDSLENELFEEKTNSARQAAQHRYEVQRLRSDLDAAYASQRNLYERIDQLTTELALIKRNGGTRTFSSDRFNGRSCSLDLRDGTSSNFLRRSISPIVHASRRTGSVSPSYYRPSASPVSQTHRYMLATTSNGSHFSSRANSAFSPIARSQRLSSSEKQSQARRFNPTEYVRQREQRLAEIALRRRVERQRQLSASSNNQGRPGGNHLGCPRSSPRLVGSATSPTLSRSCLSPALSVYSSSESLPQWTSHPFAKRKQDQVQSVSQPNRDDVRRTLESRHSRNRRPGHSFRSHVHRLPSSDEEFTAHSEYRNLPLTKKQSVRGSVPVNGRGDNSRRSNSVDRQRLPNSDCDSNHSSSPVSIHPVKQHQKCGSHHDVACGRNPELDEIDRRLSVLQSFFHKYLGDT
ncbi:Coiled-coil domain-containing protein 61 [Clonorchis sinensis]|uniref:Coiled-coil domain-containing protein 61 n=1 Tax=Clonorchis sinensis TaxID=79923 RepID=A0A8T1MHR7_CLOSI|nr:Coiled-coil domain-containing protein 61 [Clonorchis sinensis]